MDQVLDLTIPQIGLVAEMIGTHRAELLNAFVGPLASAMGSEYKGAKYAKKGNKKPTRKPRTAGTSAALDGEDAVLNAALASRVMVKTKR